MSTDQPASVTAGNQCGACNQVNPDDAKFCAGCGQSLVEPCISCNTPVLLTQKFCGDCGTDLQAELQKRISKLNQSLSMAVEDAKRTQYEDAIGALRRISRETDFRYREVAERASQILDRVTKLRDEGSANADSLSKQAKEAFEGKDPERAIHLLEQIPESLLDDDSSKLLREARNFVEQVSALNADLQQAMRSKDWRLMGGLLTQLLALLPKNPNYRQAATKISARLIQDAKKCLESSEYDNACENLESVPECERDEDYEKLLSKIDSYRWYQHLLDNEPLATPSLGKLAVRFAKESGDPKAAKTVQQLAQVVKTKPSPRHAFNDWNGSTESWIGGRLGILGLPTKLNFDDSVAEAYQKQANNMLVAVGLTLQALNQSRITASLYSPKKGLLGGLSKKKGSRAWGIDVGTTELRAVLVEVVEQKGAETQITVKDVYSKAHDIPLCRPAVIDRDDVIQSALKEFVEQKSEELEGASVWVNLAAKEMVNRFICLPPVKDKEAAKMLEDEILQQIPLDQSDLSVVSWMAPLDLENSSMGRPAFIAAARSVVVEKRVQLCEAAGLTVSGIQADTVALANFASFEFADELETDNNDEAPPAVVLLDCGASTTSAIVVTANSTALSTFEIGGEDLTGALARDAKHTLTDSDALKRNPVNLENPMGVFLAFDQRLEQLRQRLQRSFSQSESKNHKFTVASTWCVGGSSLCLTWLRRVLTKD